MDSNVAPLIRAIESDEAESLLDDWRWLVSRELTPLFLSTLGDWVFGAPDGSLWMLDMLEGDLREIAANASEYNRLEASPDWFEHHFSPTWYEVAIRQGIVVAPNECVGWARHPALGGKFEKANLKKFSMRVYQSLMGQLHRQLRGVKAE